MHYGEIKKYDIANGPGVRVSLFVSGCRHHCKGCFNAQTWDFAYGQPFTEQTEQDLLQAIAPSYITGFSLLGGEPFEPENQRALCPLVQKVKETYPNKTIWCYSGYLFDHDIVDPKGKVHCSSTFPMLSCLDVLVDGEYIDHLKDISLQFCGSSNQRIIDIPKSLKQNKVILYNLD